MFHKENSSTLKGKKKKAQDVSLRKSDRRNLLQRAKEVLQLGSQEDETSTSVLEAAFLQGQVTARAVQTTASGIKATLYFRSPTTAAETNSDSPNWPYRCASQCIWMQVEKATIISNEQQQQLRIRNNSATTTTKNNNKTPVYDIPSLALLAVLPHNKTPSYLPTVWIASNVSKYLCRGAHLMRAGMTNVPPIDDDDNSSWPVVAIAVHGNPQVMVVGLLHPDLVGKKNDNDIALLQQRRTGIGVTIVSCYGDDLWRQQCCRRPPPSLSSGEPSSTSLDAGHYGNPGFVDGKYVVPIKEEKGDSVATTDVVAATVPGMAASRDDKGNDRNANNDNVELMEKSQPIQQRQSEECRTTVEGVEEASPAIIHDTVLTGQQTEQQEVLGDGSDDPSFALSPEQVLHAAVCKALATMNPKQDLPMTVANFYSQKVLPNRPINTTIQLKQTKYKKFGVYLLEQVKAGLLVVGPDPSKKKRDKNSDPMALLLNFDKRHADLREYVKDVSRNKSDDDSTRNTSKRRLVLVDLYCLPQHFASLLRLETDAVKAANASSPERRNTGLLTLKEMRAILDDYIVREELLVAGGGTVQLDGPLTDALYKRKKQGSATATAAATTPPESLSRRDLAAAWEQKMEPAYALVELPGNRMVKLGRGLPPVVTIEVSKRQNKKFVTRVRGVEDFGIDASGFAKDVSHRFACSSSIEEAPSQALRKGHVELVFQGNLVDELEALLVDETLSSHGGAKGSDYNLPKNAIRIVLRKGVPARKQSKRKSSK